MEQRWFRIAGILMVAFVVISFTLPLFSPFFDANDNVDQSGADTLAPRVSDFVLPSTAGGTVRLSEITSSHAVTVLVFHRGRGCPTCRDQMRAIQANYTALQQEGAEVVAVSSDTQEDAELFAERVAAAFPVLFDDANVVHSVYGLTQQIENDVTMAFFIVDGNMRLIVDPLGISGEQTLPVDVLLQTIRETNGAASTAS